MNMEESVKNLNDRTDYYHDIYMDRVGLQFRLRIIGRNGAVRNTELMDAERMMDCLTWIELGMSLVEGW